MGLGPHPGAQLLCFCETLKANPVHNYAALGLASPQQGHPGQPWLTGSVAVAPCSVGAPSSEGLLGCSPCTSC